MTTRRTVDSKAGTLKKMSKMIGKSAFAKLFSITAIGLIAASLMSFAQKDDTVSNNKNLVATNTVAYVTSDYSDSFKETISHVSVVKMPKVVLSEEFVNTLRNLKLEILKADREIAKRLYLAEVSKKEAVVFFRNSQLVMKKAEMEVSEQMKAEAIKYTFLAGNADVINEASGEVEDQMKEAALKIAVNSSMKTDVLTADEEVASGLKAKSPETAIAGFMKGSSKNIADADAEISNTIKAKVK